MAVTRLQEMLGDLNGKTIGLLGLSFKPNTDDMRDAPAIDIANALIAAGATVRAYDPVAMEVAAPAAARRGDVRRSSTRWPRAATP